MAQPQPRWMTEAEVAQVDLPPGGSTGQVLAKTSNADRAVDWTTVAGTGDVVGPGSATEGHLAVFADGTGKLIEDGGAPGGGGSFLSANTARVDPSGNDGTGEIGDLSKPFLTVQAAIDAIIDLAVVDSAFVVDVGKNQFEEDVTVDAQVILVFVGSNCDTSSPFISLTSSAEMTIYGTNCALGNIETSEQLTMFLQESRTGDITSTAEGGTLTIGSYYNTAAIGEVLADDVGEIYVFGVVPTDARSITSANATEVTLRTLKQNSLLSVYDGVFSVSTPAAELSATDCLLNEIECSSAQFLDSRILSEPTIPQPIEYENHLLPNLEYTFTYDFSRDGGAEGDISLFNPAALSLPSGFIITGATLDVTTPLFSENSLATVALGSSESDDDVVAATVITNAPWDTVAITSINLLTKMDNDNVPSITVAVEDLTQGGAFSVNFRGFMAQT